MDSKRRIEVEINRQVKFFSYPYGELADFNDQIKNTLKSEALECAVTCVYGRNDLRSDLLQLKRVRPLNYGALGFRIVLSIMSSKAGEPLRKGYHLLRKGMS